MPRARRPWCPADARRATPCRSGCCCGCPCPGRRRPARRPTTPCTAVSSRIARSSACRPRARSTSRFDDRSRARTPTARRTPSSQPTYSVADPQFGPLGDDTMISPRLAPQVIGMGLLEAIPEDDLSPPPIPTTPTATGSPGDPTSCGTRRRGDWCSGGSAGRPTSPRSSNRSPGRSTATSGSRRRCIPSRTAPTPRTTAPRRSTAATPSSTDDQLANVTFYGRTLSVPAMRDVDSTEVREGAALFDSFGCASCHTPTQTHGRQRRRRAGQPGDPSVHRPAAPRHGPRTRRRPARLRGDRGGVAHAAAVGHRPRRRHRRGALPAPRRTGGDDRGGDPLARRRGRGGRRRRSARRRSRTAAGCSRSWRHCDGAPNGRRPGVRHSLAGRRRRLRRRPAVACRRGRRAGERGRRFPGSRRSPTRRERSRRAGRRGVRVDRRRARSPRRWRASRTPGSGGCRPRRRGPVR